MRSSTKISNISYKESQGQKPKNPNSYWVDGGQEAHECDIIRFQEDSTGNKSMKSLELERKGEMSHLFLETEDCQQL
jgi:hypothetical protein